MNTLTLRAARIVGPLELELDWSTGETLRLDLSAWLRPPFDALRDPALFAQMQVDDWGGHGLNWPGGLDLGADNLYALAREQAGLPTLAAGALGAMRPCSAARNNIPERGLMGILTAGPAPGR